jgi:hypothetical protein
MLLPRFSTLDMEYKAAVRRILALQRAAGLARKMRNFDAGERTGAFGGQTAAMREKAEHLASQQHRQGSVQIAQFEKHRQTSSNHPWLKR